MARAGRRVRREFAVPALFLASVALVAAALSLACSRGAPGPDVALEIEAEAIAYSEFDAYLTANGIADAPSLDPKVLSGLFDQFIAELLLERLARERQAGGRGSEAGEGGGSRQAGSSEVRRLIARETATPSEDEVRAYYRSHASRFVLPERVRLRQILVEDRGKAEQAIGELRRGHPFDQIARTYSEGPRAQDGGDQGWLGREDLPPDLARRIFALDEGQVSSIVAADYGFHIFFVEGFEVGREVPLAEARAEIERELAERARNDARTRLVGTAVERYNVRVYGGNLPFHYQGRHRR